MIKATSSRSQKVHLFVATAMALASCRGEDGESDGGTTPDGSPVDATMDAPVVIGEVPCDVATVLEDNCIECHGNPPRFGAPMPLTSHAALTAPTPSDLGTPVYEMIGMRIHDSMQPMPPRSAGELTDAEKAILDAYVEAMAPTRPAGSSCDPMDGGAPDGGDGGSMSGVGPEHLHRAPSPDRHDRPPPPTSLQHRGRWIRDPSLSRCRKG